MAPRAPLEVRYSQPFHLTLAVIGIGLVAEFAAYGLFFATDDVRGQMMGESLPIVALSAIGLLYYAVRSIIMLRDRRPQVLINGNGIWLGFGRGVQINWQDIHWMRLKGLRPVLQLGIAPHLFPTMRVSIWHLDDNLTAVQ